MTLEELADTLPNGLHDAELLSLRIDYAQRLLSLDLRLLVGAPDAPSTAGREARRTARVTLRGLVYCVIDPPDARYLRESGRSLTIDVGSGEPGTAPSALPPVPPGAFLAWIFVAQWNGFIRVAAHDAEVSPLPPP